MDYFMVIIDGMKQFVTTLWELQEMRFSAIFDDLSYIAMTIIMAAASCFIDVRAPITSASF
ncbi:hypothetical protein BC332_32846 [Capsicum chinense]|nr:hypothetical protein BC332_32846 [Capsicum chinense]